MAATGTMITRRTVARATEVATLHQASYCYCCHYGDRFVVVAVFVVDCLVVVVHHLVCIFVVALSSCFFFDLFMV